MTPPAPLSPYACLAPVLPAGPAREALAAVLADPLPALSAALRQWEGQGQGLPLAVRVALFAKSPEAFAMAHPEPGDDPELAQALAALPAADQARTRRLVCAHRTWQVGQVLGQVLSGADQETLEEWGAANTLREQWEGNRVAWLRHAARTHDGPPDHWREAGVALDADIHCFIAHPAPETDAAPARLGTIALGVSVAQPSLAEPAHRLAQAVRQVRALADQQLLAGTPNPHHGYRVLPFLCHAGVFATPPLPASPWHDWLAPSFPAPPESQSPATLLAQAPFWSLFGHPRTTPTHLEALRGLNPHILGCDTLALYEHLALEISAGPDPRELPLWVLRRACALAQALAERDLTTTAPEAIATFVQATLQTLERLAHHHLKAFPVVRRQALPDDERQALAAFASTLSTLCLALRPGPWAALAGNLRAAAAHAATMSGPAPAEEPPAV